MRSFLCLYILSLAVSAFSTPLETETQVLTQRFNPDATEVHAHQARSLVSELSQLQDRRLTNAERLARHYPLKPPHRRSIIHKTRLTSMVASNYTIRGYLQVLDESYSSLGFVSKEYNKYGEYGVLTNDSADYLSVSLNMDEASSKSGVISTINGPLAAYPFFGAIVGFNSTSNDLGQGSYDYSVFGGTVQRSAGAAAIQGGNSFTHLTGMSRPIETAIFSHNQSSNEVSSYWVNDDGSRPETYMGFNGQEAALFITGDKTAFTNKYGSNMIYWITLKLVPVN